MERGHRVRLLTQQNFADFVAGYGVEFYPLPGNMEALMESADVREGLRTGNNITLLKALGKGMEKIQPELTRGILEGTEATEAMVTNMIGVPIVTAIGEKTGKPWATVHLSSPLTPTGAFPFAGLDRLNFPAYNRFTYWVIWTLTWVTNKRLVNDFRQELGLKPIQQAGYDRMVQESLNLYALSPAFLTRPADWGSQVDITGFLVLPQKARAAHQADRIPEGLDAWLLAGEKPVYIGFGSIPVPSPEALATVIEALLIEGRQRIIFCQGWSAMPPVKEHPHLFVVRSVSHEWLLPRCSVAVIHGGIGTLAAVLRAGIPAVIVSIFGDQPWWGKYIQRQKLGTFLPFKRMDSRRLKRALAQALLPECRSRAAELGASMRQEDGVGRAAARVEAYFVEGLT
jgi:UDP:flavonoid glycosyltransferase YjiC (YdhE family)